MTEGSNREGAPELPEISATELREKMERDDDFVLVDVREPHERSIADLPDVGQLRLPVGEFEARMEEELDPDREIVVYCRSGARSGWAVSRLREAGFRKVWNLKGGILAWREEVDPSLTAY